MPSMFWIGSGKPRHTTVWFLTTQKAPFEFVEPRSFDSQATRRAHQPLQFGVERKIPKVHQRSTTTHRCISFLPRLKASQLLQQPSCRTTLYIIHYLERVLMVRTRWFVSFLVNQLRRLISFTAFVVDIFSLYLPRLVRSSLHNACQLFNSYWVLDIISLNVRGY
jgi:hypothetical protein